MQADLRQNLRADSGKPGVSPVNHTLMIPAGIGISAITIAGGWL